MAAAPTRVLIVEDHELLAQSLRIALSAEGYEVAVPELQTDVILATASEFSPDVALLDLDLGDSGPQGDLLVEPLTVGGACVVVVSGSPDYQRIAGCLESGAHGYIPKTSSLDDLTLAISRAASGEPVMADSLRQDMLSALRRARVERARLFAPFETLTQREQFVLWELMQGRSAGAIAAASYVSEATVRTQIRAILLKLDVRSQLSAVAKAQQVNWRPKSG